MPVTPQEGAAERPEPGLSVAAVARRMGVAPATLRTWDRRYGIGPSDHRPGAHRRYTAADLARLDHMRQLVIAGIPPAQAALASRDLSVDYEQLAPVTRLPVTRMPVTRLSETHPSDGPTQMGRPGGGTVIPLPGGSPVLRGLARAAQTLDMSGCTAIIMESLDSNGVQETWDTLLVPVLAAVGQRWETTGRGIEVEHALSTVVQECLARMLRGLAEPVNCRAVLLACAPGETHSLPLWAVAAGLAEHGVYSRVFGTGLPGPALKQAVHRIGPAAVFLWAQVAESCDFAYLRELPTFRPTPTVLAGGPGWFGDRPAEVCQVADLGDTVARIVRAVGE